MRLTANQYCACGSADHGDLPPGVFKPCQFERAARWLRSFEAYDPDMRMSRVRQLSRTWRAVLAYVLSRSLKMEVKS